jgi:hypothetical protein
MNDEVRKYLSEIGRRGGKVSGGRKALSSAHNGRRGYAPRPNRVQVLKEREERTLDHMASGSVQ